MCSKCADVDRLVTEVNEGKRAFDADVLRATLLQTRHVLDEALTDIDSGTKPLHELLAVCSDTMHGLGAALLLNARTVAHAAHVERDRLVALATQAEQEQRDRKDLEDHLIGQHEYDEPGMLVIANLAELRRAHQNAHRANPNLTATDRHIETGRDV